MTQLVKAFASKSDNLSLIPGAYMVEGENKLFQILLKYYGFCTPSLMHTDK